jgi:heterodisulfide reductase subunit B
MKIPYYPGCTLNTVAKHFDASAKESGLKLGFEMEETPQWNCCGASFPLTPDNTMGLAAAAKVLAEVRKEGDTVTTLCSVCYNVLKRTNGVIRGDKERRGVINDFIEEDYDGSLDVIHYLEVLRDRVGFEKVKGAVKRPLTGIKAGAYYGCMLRRPFEDMGIDDSEAPTILEDTLTALGSEAVDFPDKIECCGSHLALGRDNEEIVTTLSGRVMTSAVGCGAELIVTSCPLCQYNLEMSQDKVAAVTAGYTPVPIVYFTQVLGLALGQAEDGLGFDKNKWDARPLLKEKGI